MAQEITLYTQETLREKIKTLGRGGQSKIARDIGKDRQHINLFMKGKSVSYEIHKLLNEYFQ